MRQYHISIREIEHPKNIRDEQKINNYLFYNKYVRDSSRSKSVANKFNRKHRRLTISMTTYQNLQKNKGKT